MTLLRSKFQGKFFYGWVIVGLAFFADLMSAGTGGYTIGLYFRPMKDDLGWDRSTITIGLSLGRVVNGVTGPLIGWVLDRFGARPVMIFGALLGSIGLASIAFVQEPWHFYILYGVVGALGIAEFGNLITGVALSKWFVRKRGRAIALATMGISVGGVVLIPVTSFMIEYAGWRMSWAVIGLLIALAVGLPTLLFMRSRPEDMGLLPDGEDPLAATTAAQARDAFAKPAAVEEVSWTLKEALRTPAFWLLILAFNFGGLGVGAMVTHQIPYIQDKGFSTEAAWVASLMAIFATACKPVWGRLVERLHARYCIMLSFIITIAGTSAIRFADSLPELYLYAVVYGSGAGSLALLQSVTWANYFGRTFIGTIRGATMPVNIVFGAGAPLFAAWVADTFHSYDPAMYVFMVTYALGAVFVFLARQPVHPSQRSFGNQSLA